jgi:hypothetical protein
MNLQGVVRQLPLFDAPVDPALLVQALASGLSLSAALSEMGAALPYHRFSFTLEKAVQFCADLRPLGEKLQTAIEKKDAEALARLRAGQERNLLNLVREVRKQQVAEAAASLNGLLASREPAVVRWQHYRELLGEDTTVPDPPTEPAEFKAVPDTKASGKFALVSGGAIKTPSLDLGPIGIGGVTVESFDTGTKILDFEQEELESSFNSTAFSVAAAASDALAALLHLIPQGEVDGKPLGVGAGFGFGGVQLGSGATALGRVLEAVSRVYAHSSFRAGKLGSFVLRERDWVAQANQAAREIDTIHKQCLAARLRLDIAVREQTNTEQQMSDAADVETFLKTKATNTELFSWLEGEIGGLWSQAHDLAKQMARRAEQCYRFERGAPTASFIAPSQYTGLKEKLIEGERLYLALRQMERSYLEQDQREYEITKHVSIASLDPLQLISLKETGACVIDLPEALFDLDFPGHYFRRIKSVSLTIPCVVGPYEGVNCSLRLLRHELRMQPTPGPQYPRQGDADLRFVVNQSSTESIATSSGQSDSGLFELNFRDERYLPFEGAGALSRWQLTLGTPFRKFDYETITDVILHLRYTARDGGDRLKGPAVKAVKDYIGQATSDGASPLYRLFSLRHEFPTQWNVLFRPAATADPDPITRTADIVVGKERFPFYLSPASIQPQVMYGVAVPATAATIGPFTLSLTLAAGTSGATDVALGFASDPTLSPALFAKSPDNAALPKVDPDATKDVWTLKVTFSKAQLTAVHDDLLDVFLAVGYVATIK